MQIGMMDHTAFEDLAAFCLKRFEARGGEILVPTRVKLAKCHYKEVLLERLLVTRADTEVVIADCGEEHLAHPAASPAEDTDSDVEFCRRSAGSTRQTRKLRVACSRAPQCFTEKSSNTSWVTMACG